MSVHRAIEELNATNCNKVRTGTEGLLRVSLIIVPLNFLFRLQGPEAAALASRDSGPRLHSQYMGAVRTLQRSHIAWAVRTTVASVHDFIASIISVHEGHHHRNFAGLFPLFDIVFGTAYFPKSDETINIGLRDKHESMTLWQYLFALKEKRLP